MSYAVAPVAMHECRSTLGSRIFMLVSPPVPRMPCSNLSLEGSETSASGARQWYRLLCSVNEHPCRYTVGVNFSIVATTAPVAIENVLDTPRRNIELEPRVE